MAKRKLKTEPARIVKTRAELAKALGGKAVRTVADYIAAGMPASPGAYDVAACQQWIAEHIRTASDEAPAAGGVMEQIKRAELEIKRQDARARKLKTDRLAGQLYNADDVERGAAEMTGRIKLRLEQLPDEIAQCVAAKERRTVCERVTQVIEQLLLEMSSWEPIELAADELT